MSVHFLEPTSQPLFREEHGRALHLEVVLLSMVRLELGRRHKDSFFLSSLVVQELTSTLGPLRHWARALLTTPCCYGCSEQASAAAAGARLVAWTSRSDSWNDTGASHVLRHVLRQASRTAVKDNQGRRQHVLPRRHGHDRTTSWPDSPRGSLTAPLAASGVLPIWPLPIWAFCISRCQSACSSPTAHGSSCTCVAESITHATYNRLESVPGSHSVRQRVYESVRPKVEVATCTVYFKIFPPWRMAGAGCGETAAFLNFTVFVYTRNA